MPVIDVSLWDLRRLVGASEQEILNALEYVKGELAGREGDRLKIEVTHDRPDHFSAEGLARTLKGVLGIEEGLPEVEIEEGSVELRYEGFIEERPYAVMAVVRDLALDDEAIVQMIQLQEKLHETYGRDRRKVAIGYYDLSKIKPPISYRRISQTDRYVPLGYNREIEVREMYEATDKGRKYASLIRREAPPALVDSDGKIMVVVPVLGSECCKVTPATRDVLIDVTGPRLETLLKILAILVYNLLERSKSRKVELVKINGGYPARLEGREIDVDRGLVSEMLGVDLGEEEYRALLRRARHDVQGGKVVVAPYRINIISWVDIAEDIAIMRGYGSISREPPPIVTAGRRHRSEISSEDARKALLSLGFQEVMNGVFYFVIDNAYIIIPGRVQVEKDLYLVGFSNMSLARALHYGWPIMIYGDTRTYIISIVKHSDIKLVEIVIHWKSNSPIITSAYEHRDEIGEKIKHIMDVAKPLLKIGATYILY